MDKWISAVCPGRMRPFLCAECGYPTGRRPDRSGAMLEKGRPPGGQPPSRRRVIHGSPQLSTPEAHLSTVAMSTPGAIAMVRVAVRPQSWPSAIPVKTPGRYVPLATSYART